jgi:hypothetical protein
MGMVRIGGTESGNISMLHNTAKNKESDYFAIMRTV